MSTQQSSFSVINKQQLSSKELAKHLQGGNSEFGYVYVLQTKKESLIAKV